jgi:hydroxymethylbilane synthase
LGFDQHITQYLPLDIMLPAPGQAALAVQCRSDDEETLQRLVELDHEPTRLAVGAERSFLAALGGGCSLPIGADAAVAEHTITLNGVVAAPDGSQLIQVSDQGSEPQSLGVELARKALAQGAAQLLAFVN